MTTKASRIRDYVCMRSERKTQKHETLVFLSLSVHIVCCRSSLALPVRSVIFIVCVCVVDSIRSIRVSKQLGQDLSGAVAAAATVRLSPSTHFVNIIFVSCDFESGRKAT